MILDEFDECKNSTFNPNADCSKIPNFPKIGVTCFSDELLLKLANLYNGKQIALVNNANGNHPIYKIVCNDVEIALFLSFVGAPACIVEYEEIFAMGLERIVVFGTCGVLKKEIDDLAIIIPTSAVRDEGTSYHYKISSDEIECNKKYQNEFIDLLNKHSYSYIKGKVWTTDAPYRETRDKVLKRKQQGCICVDMESSAISALAEFRNKEIFQFFYAADNLDNAKWDMRSLLNDTKLDDKEKIGLLAIEFASIIDDYM